MNIHEYSNPLAPRPDKRYNLPPGRTLAWYIRECGIDAEKSIVVRNGGIVPHKDLDTLVPADGDDILVRPFVAGSGGGKEALNILVMAAVVVGSVMMGPLGVGLSGWALALAVGGISAAGAAISTYAIGQPTHATTDTPTYGWGGPQTTAQQGLPVPVPVGTYTNNGNVIDDYVESINDQQFMRLLIDLGVGPAKSIYNIRVNNQPIETLINAKWDVRLGKNVQSVCPDFSQLVNTVGVEQRILAGPSGSPIVVNGLQNDTEAAQFEFYFPKGIWAGPNSDGSYDSWAVMLQIEYQKVGDPGWTTYVVPGVLNPVGEVPFWLGVVQDYRYDNGMEVVVLQSNDPNAHHQGETFQTQVLVNPVDTNNVQKIPQTITVTGTWKVNPAHVQAPQFATGTTYATPGSWSTVACAFESNEGPTPKRFSFRVYLPSPGQYNYRITKIGSGQHATSSAGLYSGDGKLFETYSRRGEETWLATINEISFQEYTYPNQILLDISLQATNQVSGGNVQVSATVEMDNPETQGYVHAVRWDQPDNYYRLADAAGLTAADLMSSQNGTYRNTQSLTFQSTSLIQNSPDFGVLAAYGDSIFTAPCSTAGDFAVELLVQSGSWQDGAALAEGSNFLFQVEPNNNRLQLWLNGAAVATGTTSLINGHTYHVAVIVQGTTAYLMLNGAVDAEATISRFGGFSSLAFGRNLTGTLDEVAFYATYIPQLCRVRKHYLDSVSDHNLLEGYAANLPPIVAMDWITNPLYGGGQSPSLIDVPFFERWAERCIEHVPDGAGGTVERFAYDGLVDQSGTLWDALTKLAHVSGCQMLRTGFSYSGVLDAPSLPKRIINISQVVKDSFKESWSNVDDRANSVDVIFYDELNFYKRTVLTVQQSAKINAGAKVLKAPTVDLRGCTKIARAWHYGNFILKSSNALSRTITFDQTIESLAAWPGEAVYIQHDLPKWGNGGKLLKNCTTTQLFLDQPLDDWDTDQTYTLMVSLKLAALLTNVSITRIVNNIVYFNGPLNDLDNPARFVTGTLDYGILDCGTNWIRLDNVEDLAVGNVGVIYAQNYINVREIGAYDPSSNMVTLTSALPVAPDEFDLWTFGSVGKGQPSIFHVGKIGRKKDLTASLELIEYQDSVYTDDVPEIDPTPVTNDLQATVTNLQANELYSPTGTEPVLAVSWQFGPSTVGSLVYWSRNGGPEVLYADVGSATSVDIDVFTGDVIKVRVVGYDSDGKLAPYNTSPTVTNTILGFDAHPSNVTGFGIAAWDIINSFMTLAWNESPETDVTEYVISYFPFIDFNPTQADCDANVLATVNGRGVVTTVLTGGLYKGVGTYAIRAVNQGGYYSLTPALIRAYSLDNVQGGVTNKTRRPSNGPMITNPPQPWVAVAQNATVFGPNGSYMEADITFYPFTMSTGSELMYVLNSPFSITGLAQGQDYYFYYDDPSFIGGNVTIHATQDANVLVNPLAQGGRFVLNGGKPVTMPVYAQAGYTAVTISRPTAYDSAGPTAPTTPELAYDNNASTYAETTVDPGGLGTQTLTYRNFSALQAGLTYSSAKLIADAELNVTGMGNTPTMEYSTDGGATWSQLGANLASTADGSNGATSPNVSYNGSQYEVAGAQLRTQGSVPPGVVTDWVIATGFGLNIPPGMTIRGVKVTFNWVGQNAGTGLLSGVALFHNGSILSAIKNPNVTSSSVPTDTVLGSSSDLWGVSGLESVANDVSFGFGVQITTEASGGSDRSFLDSFSIEVSYSPTTTTPSFSTAISPAQDMSQLQVRVTPGYVDVSNYTMVKIFDIRVEATAS